MHQRLAFLSVAESDVPAGDEQTPHCKGKAKERHNIMTSLACSALCSAIGPGALLRRGTRRRTPFSQHSACNIVFFPHNAAPHTGFIMLCQSAGIRNISAEAAGDALRWKNRSCLFALWVFIGCQLKPLLLRADVYVSASFICCCTDDCRKGFGTLASLRLGITATEELES